MTNSDWFGLLVAVLVMVGWIGMFFLVVYLTDPEVVARMELKSLRKRIKRDYERKTREDTNA